MQAPLWQSLTRFDRAKIAPGVAFRNTLGIVMPVAVGVALGQSSAGVVVALGALNASYSDSQEPYGTRARKMLFASVLVGVAVALGALSAKSNLLAIAVAILWAFGAGMMPAAGQRAADLGSMSLVTLVVFAARRLTFTEAVGSGLLAAGGGVLQTLLSVAFWPVHRYEPERRTLAHLYGTLSNLAVLPAGRDAPPPATAQINEANEVLHALAARQDDEADRYIFLLNQAERIRVVLLTLRRLRARIDRHPEAHDGAKSLEQVLLVAGGELERIAGAITRGSDIFLTAEFEASVHAFRQHQPHGSASLLSAEIRDAQHQIDALSGQLRAAGHPGSLGPQRADVTIEKPDWRTQFIRLRANLNWQSTAFRHAVRLATCIGIGDAISRAIDFKRTYWIPMTIAIVLRPDFTGTFSRGILRIAGTLAGLLLATALFHGLAAGQVTEIVLLAVFTYILRWIGPANYGVFVTALSAFIVIFIALTGVAPKSVIEARAINTISGGVIALAAYAIWPTWERARAGTVFADLLDAYRAYFNALIEAYKRSDVDRSGELYRVRMKARLQRSNTEAAIGRILAEPGLSRDRANLLTAILTTSHGFARAALAIESALDENRRSPPRPATISFAAKVTRTLDGIADALRTGRHMPPDLPDLRAAHNAILASTSVPDEQYTLINTETDRIATSLNTFREQAAKYLSSEKP